MTETSAPRRALLIALLHVSGVALVAFSPTAEAQAGQVWYAAFNMVGVTGAERDSVNQTALTMGGGAGCSSLGSVTGPTLTQGKSYIVVTGGTNAAIKFRAAGAVFMEWNVSLGNPGHGPLVAGGYDSARPKLLYSESNSGNPAVALKFTAPLTGVYDVTCSVNNGIGGWATASYPSSRSVGHACRVADCSVAIALYYADNDTNSRLPDYYSAYSDATTCNPCIPTSTDPETDTLSVNSSWDYVVAAAGTSNEDENRLIVLNQTGDTLASIGRRGKDSASGAGAPACYAQIASGGWNGYRLCKFTTTSATTSVHLKLDGTTPGRFIACGSWTLPNGVTCDNSTNMGGAVGAFTYDDEVVGWLFDYGHLNDSTGAFNGPAAPVLTGTRDGRNILLTWTTPDPGPMPPILGYVVTRVNHLGHDPETWTLGVTNSFTDLLGTRNKTYTVYAFTAGGDGNVSNNVTMLYSPDLFGDQGIIYAGDKAETAAALGVTGSTLGILYGLVFVIVFGALGFIEFGKVGAAVGIVGGVFAALAWNMFPLWVILLLCALGAASFVLYRKFTGGAGS